MARYIDVDNLKSSVKAFNGGKDDFFVGMIDCTPIADVQEVKHGKWNLNTDKSTEKLINCLMSFQAYDTQVELQEYHLQILFAF